MTKELENVVESGWYMHKRQPSPPFFCFFLHPSLPQLQLWKRAAFLCLWFWDKISLGSSYWPWTLNRSASTSECWDYRCMLPCPALTALFKICGPIWPFALALQWFLLHSGVFISYSDGCGTQGLPHVVRHSTWATPQGFILGPRKWILLKAVGLGALGDEGRVSLYSRGMTNAGKVEMIITMR